MKLIENTVQRFNLCMYSVAAAELAQQNNIEECSLLLEMAGAIRKGELKVRDPKTGAYFVVDAGMDNPSPYVNYEDLNNWLSIRGYQFQFQPNPLSKITAAKNSPPINNNHPPLVKHRIANAFAGLHFDGKKWRKHLSDPPLWLKSCRVSMGSKGRKASATWDPTKIGLELLDKGVTLKQLDNSFLLLKEWQTDWHEKTQLLR